MKYAESIDFIEHLIDLAGKAKVKKINMRYIHRDIVFNLLDKYGTCEFLSKNLGFEVKTLTSDLLDENAVLTFEQKVLRLFTNFYGSEMTNKEWAEKAKVVVAELKAELKGE